MAPVANVDTLDYYGTFKDWGHVACVSEVGIVTQWGGLVEQPRKRR
jgi:hypothetical protein